MLVTLSCEWTESALYASLESTAKSKALVVRCDSVSASERGNGNSLVSWVNKVSNLIASASKLGKQ